MFLELCVFVGGWLYFVCGGEGIFYWWSVIWWGVRNFKRGEWIAYLINNKEVMYLGYGE